MKKDQLITPTFTKNQIVAGVNTRSALPGQSEHQLGTAVDLATSLPGVGYKLEQVFEESEAFLWLQKNGISMVLF